MWLDTRQPANHASTCNRTRHPALSGPHEFDAVGAGQHQVEQDQGGLLRLDELGQLLGVGRHDRPVARGGERVTQVAQHLGVVVDDRDAGRLTALSRRARARP